MKVYLDNAATTKLDNEVFEAMLPYMKEEFGNPSSIYSYGRETRMAIENARKTVAKECEGHNGSARGLSLSGDQAEGLLPFGWTQHDGTMISQRTVRSTAE